MNNKSLKPLFNKPSQSRIGIFKKEKTEKILKGTIEGHKDGFAFFTPEDGSQDVFIHNKNLAGAVHGDTVSIKTGIFKGRPEGTVLEIIERGVKKVIGVADSEGRGFRIIPFSQHFTYPIIVKDSSSLQDGDVVICKIEKYPSGRSMAHGRIEEKVGHITDVGIDNKIVTYKYNLSREFPSEVMKGAECLSIDKSLYKKVTDFRDMFTVTIDGETARDFDDAISVDIEKSKFVLYVHIADVSRFVTINSLIDKEAQRRGTSTYFPEFAIPMLPERLCNDLCSLVPNEDRFTVTAKIVFSDKGDKLETSFYRSVIKSDFRLTYNYVNDCLSGAQKYKSKELESFIGRAKKLSDILEDRRKREGGIDFDLPEASFKFGEDGRVADIYVTERGFSERMIEYFMIAANEAVAEYFDKNKVPAIYRVHKDPDEKKVEDWVKFAKSFGLEVPHLEYPINVDTLRRLSEIATESRYSKILNSLLVRSMMRAEYSVNNIGHFGLASDAYTHFTSPIRRYPDLLVHRALMANLGLGEKSEPIETLKELAGITSKLERLADDAESEISLFKKLEYLELNEYDTFDAYVNRVNERGAFVYVERILLSGALIDDGFERPLEVGDNVKVKLYSLDITTMTVNFIIPKDKKKGKKGRIGLN